MTIKLILILIIMVLLSEGCFANTRNKSAIYAQNGFVLYVNAFEVERYPNMKLCNSIECEGVTSEQKNESLDAIEVSAVIGDEAINGSTFKFPENLGAKFRFELKNEKYPLAISEKVVVEMKVNDRKDTIQIDERFNLRVKTR